MPEFKYIELEVVASNPEKASYKFTIHEQSHRNKEFGEYGSNVWSYGGFKLVSITQPEVKYKSNKLFVRGDYSGSDNIHLYVIPKHPATPSMIKFVNTWFTNMLAAVHAYNNYYSKVIRTNILHKY